MLLASATMFGTVGLAAKAATAQSGSGGVIAASSDDVIVSGVMDSYRGVTVWSEQDLAGSGNLFAPPTRMAYRLTASIGGKRGRLPVRPRRAPFDVNLGPDGKGGVVAAYSRCGEAEDQRGSPYPTWAKARGCDLFRYDFSTGKETKIGGASTSQASETQPSIWKDEIAFVRTYTQRSGRRGKLPYLYVRKLGKGESSRQQPGGARSSNGGPRRIDLYGRRLSFVWEISGAGKRTTSELRLDTVGSTHRRLSRARASAGGSLVPSYTSPQGADGRIRYGYQRVRSGDKGEATTSKTSLLLTYRISDRDRSLRSAPPLTIDQSVDGGKLTLGIAQRIFTGGDPGTIVQGPATP